MMKFWSNDMDVRFDNSQEFAVLMEGDTDFGIEFGPAQHMDVVFNEQEAFACKLEPGEAFAVHFGGSEAEDYHGLYEVTPKAHIEQVLLTANKRMIQDVTVHQVPVYETTNDHGTTVYIAEG